MSLGWDSYFVAIDGRTASILVDLDPPSAETVAHLPQLLFVRIGLHHPGDHGLTTDAELEELSVLEQELEAHVENGLRGRYVGRFTHNGQRTYLVYVPKETPEVAELVQLLRARGYSAKPRSSPIRDGHGTSIGCIQRPRSFKRSRTSASSISSSKPVTISPPSVTSSTGSTSEPTPTAAPS